MCVCACVLSNKSRRLKFEVGWKVDSLTMFLIETLIAFILQGDCPLAPFMCCTTADIKLPYLV